jgi:SlyX protein
MQRNKGMNMETRLAEIEMKLSFSEELLEALNSTVYRQQQQIDQLQQELRALREQVRSAVPAEPRNLLDETPPHY